MFALFSLSYRKKEKRTKYPRKSIEKIRKTSEYIWRRNEIRDTFNRELNNTESRSNRKLSFKW